MLLRDAHSFICEGDHCRKHGFVSNNMRRMSAPGSIFDKSCIPRTKPAHRAVAQANLKLSRENNHILSAWGWMPIDKRSDW